MTPEEAIDYLLDPIGKREQHDDAIRMAVEALEKQLSNHSEIPNSSDDLISRQAAIDELHMHLMYRMGTESNKQRLDAWINNLPSVQPELIEKAAYIRGFEQGRTQGMIDAQGGKK